MAYRASCAAQGDLLGRIWESPSHDRTLPHLRPHRDAAYPIKDTSNSRLSHLAPRETSPKRDSLPFEILTSSHALFPAPGFVLFSAAPSLSQLPPEGPTSEKAQKSYKRALEEVPKHRRDLALDGFKKADKQDQGRCLACQQKMIQYGLELAAADETVAEAQGEKASRWRISKSA
jgi:hypothetical protein